MQVYLQFGFGMMGHSRSLLRDWNGGTAILSPRDLTSTQLGKLSQQLRDLPNGQVLFDPQFYLPHADHDRLCRHEYWPNQYETGIFFQGPQLALLMEKLKRLNDELDTQALILPGLLANQIDEVWLQTQAQFLEEGQRQEDSRPIYQTIALSEGAVNLTQGIVDLLEFVSDDANKADGYYIVAEHPQGNYLVDNPNWIANILDLCAGLKLLGRKVILGYSNHQMLIAGLVKVDAICSGTWMNVRSFPPEKFRMPIEDEIRKRATWFYCPQAFSEYKLPYLDIAKRQGVLSQLEPNILPLSDEVRNLFSGPQPSTIGLSESVAFSHYLHSLHQQAQDFDDSGFDAAVEYYREKLNNAEGLLESISRVGVTGQMRDFKDVIDANRAAMEVIITDRGSLLRRSWDLL